MTQNIKNLPYTNCVRVFSQTRATFDKNNLLNIIRGYILSYNQQVMDNTVPPDIEGGEKNLDRRNFLKKAGLGTLAMVTVAGTTGLAKDVLAQDIKATPTSTEIKSYLSPDEIMKKHAEAIAIGEDEFFGNIKKDPEVAGLQDNEYRDYTTEVLDDFFRGKDDGTMGEIVKYSPSFTGYVIDPNVKNDFPLAGELEKEYQIAESRANIAESRANIADSLERQKALKRLIYTLSGSQT